jgi:predicted Ser/Thr protein kinase
MRPSEESPVPDTARTFDENTDVVLGRIAVERGLITPAQLDEARREQARRTAPGPSDPVTLTGILVSRGFLSGKTLASLHDEIKRDPSAADRPAAGGPAPAVLGKYAVAREVGRGAMGVVYEATDRELGRRVALKLMLPAQGVSAKESAVEEALFAREAQMCAKLAKHPNLVGVYEAGVIDGRRFIAMEFVDGRPMSTWWTADAPPARQQVRALRDVALAVHHAHEHGILHRDLKPKNVLIDGQGRPYVTDFGMAKWVRKEPGLSSSSGTVVGTPSYMSPEQARGSKDLDRRTDVYALGAMLYEILTGRPPFRGESSIVALMKVIQEPVPPPSSVSPEWAATPLDKSVESVCMKAMAKRPEERYATALEFAEALSRWLGESSPATPVSPAPPARRRVAWILAAGLGGFALLAASGLAILRRDPWRGAVDLLALVDPERDAVAGAWTRRDGALRSDAFRSARLQVPYRPPEEYRARLVFRRLDGNADVNLLLSRAGRPFLFAQGAFGNTVFGFGEIGGRWAHENDSTVRRSRCLEPGRTYTLVVHVGRDVLQAWLDDRLITEARADGSDLSRERGWSLPDPAALGLGTAESPTEFLRFEVLEIGGRGRRTRP